jgi:hypothetical protein
MLKVVFLTITSNQAAQQLRKDDCHTMSHEVGMLKKFGKHPYLPQFHGVAQDGEGTRVALMRAACSLHIILSPQSVID